ncbi:MAG TPA: hypothetical protein VFK69_01225 [Candidatus Eisenbacteria bacterium]|nr:hypothetical protein [Candidatus Eisenbacteria bacterium]
MSLHLDEHLDLCAAQTLGVLDDAGGRRLTAHLDDGCQRCEDALARMHSGLQRLAASLPAAPAPPALRMLVIGDAAADANQPVLAKEGASYTVQQGPPRALFTWQGWLFLYLAIVLGVVAVMANGDASRMRKELAAARALQARLSQEYLQAWGGDQAFTSAGARIVALAPARPGAARGRAALEPGGRHAVIVAEAITVPSGRQAVAWAVPAPGGATVGAARWLGVLQPTASGSFVLHASNVGAPAGVRVTLEPAGSSGGAPTGPVVLSGAIAP